MVCCQYFQVTSAQGAVNVPIICDLILIAIVELHHEGRETILILLKGALAMVDLIVPVIVAEQVLLVHEHIQDFEQVSPWHCHV